MSVFIRCRVSLADVRGPGAAIELALSLTREALRALDAGEEDAPAAASAAKAYASETARMATAEALQLHGGLGMTEEQDIGLFFKRA